jgi:hypothetical protein
MEAGSKIIAHKGHFLLKGKGKYSLSLSAQIPRLLLNFLKAFTTTSLSGTTGIAITAGLLLLFLFASITVFSQTQTFPGNGIFTVPAGVTSITVECWGGGGRGGSTSNSGTECGGGGGGAYSRSTLTVIPGNTYNVIVGTGSSTAAAGGDSYFDNATILLAKGGNSVANNTAAGATGGAAAFGIGTIKFSGGNGASGISGNYGGGGGSSAGSLADGATATNQNGAIAPLNGGNGGNGKITTNGNGSPGSIPGGGGGGVRSGNNESRTGGAGANGSIVISWTCQIYSLTSTVASSVCSGNSSTVTLTSTATGLPVGSYTVTYNLTGTNTAIGSTAVFTVTTAGSAIFNTSILTNGGATTITITNLASAGCSNTITANNTGNITVSSIPSQPGTITGNDRPCAGTSQIYSVTNIAGTTYTWVFPVGWTQTGGGTTNSVTVTVGATTGNITVTPSNTCGAGTARLLAVTPITTPVLPSLIAGSSTPCVGTSQGYSVTNIAGTTYTWIFPAGWTQTAGGTTNSVTVTVGATTGSITVTPSNTCGAGTARLLPVTPITTPSQPSAIAGSTTPCVGTSQAYSVTNVTGTSYIWTFPSGWIQTAGGTTNSVTVTVGATPGNITATPSNTCGNGLAQSLAIIPMSVPAQPGAISGTVDQCSSLTGQVYSIAALPNATSYNWTVPAGWLIISGQGTVSVTVTTGTSGQNGNISVTAQNSCGTSVASTIAVTVLSLPAQTSTISPVTPEVCQNSIQNYMVNPQAPTGVTYTWTGPPGSTILSGQGTYLIQIRFGNTSGTLTITPSNICGNGPSQSMAITVQTTVPSQPGVISGLAAPCSGTNQTYSVPVVSGVTYSWSVPAGWSITAGQGTNSITTVVGPSSGNIQAIAGNACGGSAPRYPAVTPQNAAPAKPSLISGNNQVCLGSLQTYSVTQTAFVTYTWSLPAGWTLNSGQGTHTISVTAGAAAGNISVIPSNDCGSGPQQMLAVMVDPTVPSDPGTISGITNPCEGSAQVYAVSSQAGVSFTWVMPAGSSITSGQGTNSITALIGPNSGNITVSTANSCGNGPVKSLFITVSPLPASPGGISGNIVFCQGTTQAYSVSNVPGTTYHWVVPSGWNITGGQGTNLITTTTGLTSGNVTVTPENTCGNGPSNSLAVTVNPLPAAETGPNGAICVGASITIGSAPVPGNIYSWTSVPAGFLSAVANPTVWPEFNTTYILLETNPVTGCSNTHSVTILANQIIAITANPPAQTICTGENVNIVLSSNISGTAFSWEGTLYSGSGTTGFTNGTGTLINQTLTNISSLPAEVHYIITATANLCVNDNTKIIITVNPAPLASNQIPAAVCSDALSGVVLNSSINGVPIATYNITAIAANGLTASAGNPVAGNGFGANEIANDAWTNNTLNPVHVIYTIIPVSSLGCKGASFTVDLTINPKPVITNQPATSICSGSSTNITLSSNIPAAYSWTLGPVTGGITGASAGSGNAINQVLTNPVNTTAGTVKYIIIPVSATGNCTGSAFTITVTVNPRPLITNSASLRICSGANTNLTLTSSTPSSFSWTIGTITGSITGALAGSGTNLSQVLTNPSNATSGTVQYIVTATSGSGGCVSSPFTITITVDPIPAVSAGANPTSVCPGVPFNLTSSSSLTWTPTVLLAENFNSATNAWVKINSSTGGTSANAAWTLRPDAYNYNGTSFHSNDNTQFYISNSFAQGWPSTTNTILRSPVIDASGFTSLSLNFYHYFRYDNNSHARVQISTNGTTWITVADYTGTQGSANNFLSSTIDLSAYAGNTSLYIQFYYYAEWGYYWAIDNVTLSGTLTSAIPVISWTSNPTGFTSSNPNPSNISQAVSTLYSVSYTNPISGCTNSASTQVTTMALPLAAITADYCAIPGKIQLTATGGGTYLWSTGQNTAVILVDIAGMYSVTVTGANGCSTSASLNVSTELIVNGNFSSGNTGFISGYTYDPTANGLYAPESEYAINNNAQYNHTNFWGYDHTSGTGTGNANFMIVNGAKYSPQPTVWEEIVAVTPNTDYYFSAWAISLNNVSPFAKLRFEVNTIQVGTTANLTAGVNNNNNPWLVKDRFYGTWNSGSSTSATIRIIDTEIAAGGNDFGLDDISFGTLAPVPFTFNPTGTIGSNNSVCEGQNLQLFANITGGMPPYHTQWSGPNGFSSTELNPIITNISLAGQGTYILTIHDSYGCAAQVKSVFITVNPSPTATLTGGGNYCQYGPSPLLTFTASGGTAPFTFTYNINGGASQTLTTFGSSNTAILLLPTTTLGTFTCHLVNVTDGIGCGRALNVSATVIVNQLPVSTFSGNNPVCPGSDGNIYTGNSGMSAYSWWISGNGSLSGAVNTANVSVTAGNTCGNPFTLDLQVTDANGCSALAEEEIMVEDVIAPAISSCPASQTYCAITGNIYAVPLLIASDNCNGTLNISYTITGATVRNGTGNNAGGLFNAGVSTIVWTVSDLCNNAAGACTTTVTIDPQSIGGTVNSSATVCNGNNTGTLILSGNTGQVIRWEYSTNGGTSWTPIANTTNSLVYTNLIVTTQYRAVVQSGPCPGVTSSSVTITIASAAISGAHNTTPLTECAGYNPANLTFTTPVSGGLPPYVYQWQENGIAIPGATLSNYDPPALLAAGTYNYNCIVTDQCGNSHTTVPKIITIVSDPSVTITGPTAVCQNEVVTLTANVTGGTGTYAYEWRSSPNGINSWTAIPGMTGNTFSPTTSIAGIFYFQVYLNPSHPECNNTSSATFSFTINAIPSCTLSGPAHVLPGSTNNTFTSTVNPLDNITHAWSVSGNGIITGLNTGSDVTVTAGATGTFTLTDNISRFGCTSFCTYLVTVSDLSCSISPVIPVANGTSTLYTAPSGMDSYSWTITGNGTITSATNGQTVTVLAGNNCNSYTLTVVLTQFGLSGTCSQTISVTDNQQPVFTPPTLSSGYCVEGFIAAIYKPGGVYYVDDLTPVRRDYYILTAGNTLLDLNPALISDNCPGTLAISWTIDFGNNGSSDMSGNGQISLVTPINFPLGDNLVTWTVTDANGNFSQESTILKVLPRPEINY